MNKYKIGEFLFNGEEFGVLVDVLLHTRKKYMVKWNDDSMTYAYDSGDVRMFKEIYKIEVGQDEA